MKDKSENRFSSYASFRRRPESRGIRKSLDSGLGFGFLRRSTSSIHGVVRWNDGKIKSQIFFFPLSPFIFPLNR